DVTAVVLISRHLFDTPVILSLIQSADPTTILQAAFSSFQSADSFFWLYVLFAISNSMMPSSADRRAWPLLFVALGTMVAALYFMGIIPILIDRYGNSAAQILSYIALAFTITILIDVIAIPILLLLEKLAERITGYRIHYR
ncbi:MAG: hypothetical protein ACPG8W_13735, partial [Candidatus Promineifilaceae bacterium]